MSAMNRLDAVAGRGLRTMLLYVRGARAPVSADEAAAALGLHRSVARGRLERLLRAGLLETSFARRSGRRGPGAGRPSKLYAAAPETEALELPRRHYPALVASLLERLPPDGREEALRSAGKDFGRTLAATTGLERARSLEYAAEAVCAAVRSLGFQATVERVEGDTIVIATPTCPLRPLVIERAEATHIDRGMWAGLVESGLEGVRAAAVECESHSCLDSGASCSVVIRLRR